MRIEEATDQLTEAVTRVAKAADELSLNAKFERGYWRVSGEDLEVLREMLQAWSGASKRFDEALTKDGRRRQHY